MKTTVPAVLLWVCLGLGILNALLAALATRVLEWEFVANPPLQPELAVLRTLSFYGWAFLFLLLASAFNATEDHDGR